ncbi:poly(A)-specific ribonuclease PARN isoform X1 [Cucurbita moschata]|uniref:Poly(A)-specific ribonuclease PARN isoform X1 n=2 Tax=Cucurbita moschata TaxID=3662 RepID=A0A6J1EWU6_CUCMO|nr:poly(A)-specific ribonuclease PARN isoform X1 [Cucurbita moschata]
MNLSRPLWAPTRLLCFIRTATYSSAAVTTPATASNSSFPLKNVTKSNFEAVLSELRSHVRAADFVAIDLEMTGITSAPWRESFEFDRFDVRYLKVKDSAEKFAVVQFGVCPFRWDSAKNSFVAHPHNFFVFPRHEILVDGPSSEFLCQTTSIEFLAKYQFDFNACIHEGISYLSRAHEDAARKRLNFAHGDETSDASSNVTNIRDQKRIGIADVLFKERMKNRLHEWRDRLLSERNMECQGQEGSNDYQRQFETIFFKMRPALTLSDFTSHQTKLIQLVIKKHFEDLCFVVVDDGDANLQQLVVYVDSRDDKELLMQEVNSDRQEAAEMKIQSAIGFRHVIDLLSSEKKLIIGHNCFLDIAHIHKKFIGSLPSTAEEFVSSIGKHFPFIMDTKILLNGNGILQQRMKKSSTSLSSAFALLCPHIAFSSQSNPAFSSGVQVEVQVDDLSSSNWNSGDKHEAGYDAFMTGCVFAQACNLMGIDFVLPSENLADNEKLQKHINHLYLSWASGDIIDLSTGNRMTEPLRSNRSKKHQAKISFENIVLIWGFPANLNARKIKECISKVFGLANIVSVYHIDESAVFVQFAKPEMVSEFLDLKKNLERHDDPISVLHPLTELFGAKGTNAAGYEAYKEICSSPMFKVLFADQAEAVGINQKTTSIKPESVKSQMHEAANNSLTADMLNETTEVQGMEVGANDLRNTNYHILRSSSM